jgi:outer membrane protein assembly factor BamB
LTALDASTGADRWTTFPELSNVQAVSSPVVAGGVAYVVTYDGANATLRTYDASNGTAIGSFNVPTPTNVFELAAPVVSNGTVYVNLTGTVTAYAPR